MTQQIIDWLREDAGMELMRMRLAAALPGGTARARAKQRTYLDGMDAALKAIIAGLERGAHLGRRE